MIGSKFGISIQCSVKLYTKYLQEINRATIHHFLCGHDTDVLTMPVGIDLCLPLWCLRRTYPAMRDVYARRFWDLHHNATGTQFSRGAIDQWPTSCASSSMDDSILSYKISCVP